MTPKALSREIKFRAWNDSKKDWEGNFSISRIGSFLRLGISQSTEGIHVMQYTGLHDKNGKEIYEGDILSVHNRESGKTLPVICEYQDNHSSVTQGAFTFNGWVWNDMPQFHDFNLPEIIGNIYENPELLTKENN